MSSRPRGRREPSWGRRGRRRRARRGRTTSPPWTDDGAARDGRRAPGRSRTPVVRSGGAQSPRRLPDFASKRCRWPSLGRK
ncbi:hypothetical protein DS079_00380 [Brachybacterium paraconglomeratum]|uniref:Uncharacterized protein n=1 Tax=Brachybacterium paraconglomeratum TaxID=173362 RepID=A0A3R8S094_9MICO|nr:hypothetical protein DS079_00380 [Brachybacterium paraconglomeratum]